MPSMKELTWYRQAEIRGVVETFPYQITVEWSEEDGVYVARVPDLPGCAAHGSTEGEAVSEARVAADLILEEKA